MQNSESSEKDRRTNTMALDIIFTIRQLGAPGRTTTADVASLNKQLAKHDLHLAVREHVAAGFMIVSLEGQRRLLLDAYAAGAEAQTIAARMPELMRATAQEGISLVVGNQPCDHNSPREASSGIGAGICGDCGAVVGERRRSGT